MCGYSRATIPILTSPQPRSEEAEKARSRQGEDQVVMDEQTGLHNANVYVCTGTKFWISIETNFIGINYVEQTKIAQIRGMLVSLPTTLKRSEWLNFEPRNSVVN